MPREPGPLIKLNRTFGEAEKGAEKPVDALKTLNLTIQSFEGKDAVERYALIIAERLGAMEAGYKKTTTAIALFGKSGANMIPLLNDIADKGFKKVYEEAERLGMILDDAVVKRIAKMNDDVKLLTKQAEVMGGEFPERPGTGHVAGSNRAWPRSAIAVVGRSHFRTILTMRGIDSLPSG